MNSEPDKPSILMTTPPLNLPSSSSSSSSTTTTTTTPTTKTLTSSPLLKKKDLFSTTTTDPIQNDDKTVFLTQHAGKLFEPSSILSTPRPAPSLLNDGSFNSSSSSSSSLAKNVASMQSTQLVQRRREMRQVQHVLDKKRAEFAKFMEECKEKQDELKAKQRQLKERVQKFEKFLRDNETKKQRALAKTISERKTREQKELECAQCQEQLKKTQQKAERIQRLINLHKQYETYMLSVLSHLPSDYLDVQDPHLNDILQRHQTLSETKADLQLTLQKRVDDIELASNQLTELVKLKNDRILVYNSQMGMLQKRLDKAKTEAARVEAMVGENVLSGKARMRLMSETKLAINNLYSRLGPRQGPSHFDPSLSLSEKLLAIQERILDLSHIVTKVETFIKEDTHGRRLTSLYPPVPVPVPPSSSSTMTTTTTNMTLPTSYPSVPIPNASSLPSTTKSLSSPSSSSSHPPPPMPLFNGMSLHYAPPSSSSSSSSSSSNTIMTSPITMTSSSPSGGTQESKWKSTAPPYASPSSFKTVSVIPPNSTVVAS